MSPHHPRAPLRAVDPYPDKATSLSSSVRLVNDAKAGLEAQLLRIEASLFRRFCLRGWLSMLLVQLRGEA